MTCSPGPASARYAPDRPEVLFGIIDRDLEPYRAVDQSWRPSLPHSGPAFGLGDLLQFAERVRAG
jgi:hypothetical protein